MSELDILPEDVREHASNFDCQMIGYRAEQWRRIRAYLLRVTAEMDTLRKRIEDAPVFFVNGGGVFTHSSGDANNLAAMRNQRAAIVVLED